MPCAWTAVIESQSVIQCSVTITADIKGPRQQPRLPSAYPGNIINKNKLNMTK